MVDLAIRGGTVVTPDVVVRADVAVDGGTIVEVAASVAAARIEIDATGLTVFPAVVDAHLHFNEPGRAEWEGAASGSRALAAGGGAVFFDMPLNSTPCTLGVADFEAKRAALEAASVADFGLWGGLVPGRIGDMAAMAERGVVGFKAFMSDSGLPEFPRADDETLWSGMREAARLGAIVAVHAENDEITRGLAQRAAGGTASEVRAFLDSRPVVAELDAIQRALLFAEESGAALHIVHISSGRGVALAYAARARGVNVSIETCAHYLFFTEADVETLGTVAKCAPPLRTERERERLWSELMLGHVDLVASDHSPTDPALKARPFAAAWGGIAGVQSTLAVMLEAGYFERRLPLDRIARLLAQAPAARFRIRGKGAVAAGHDADLALVDLASRSTLTAGSLQQRHKTSPYIGRLFRGVVRQTLRRGETIYRDGEVVANGRGRLVRPSKPGALHV